MGGGENKRIKEGKKENDMLEIRREIHHKREGGGKVRLLNHSNNCIPNK